MAGSKFVHAACFAVGALVGGVATAVSSRRRPIPPTPVAEKVRVSRAVIELGPSGSARISTALVASTESSVLKYGYPGPVSDLLERKAYVAAYDRRLRHPVWTAEHLTLASLSESDGDRAKSTFTEDTSLPVPFRALLKDYYKSGYDRGHMASAADAKSSQEAMDETFLLSNIAPQVGVGFNRHYWAYLEDWCRRLTGSFSDVYIFTVPLYLPCQESDGKWRVTHEMIGSPPNIAVPTHFAKVILVSRPSSPSTPDTPEISTGAFVLPNAAIPGNAPLTDFLVPVEAVERSAGLTIFSDALKIDSKCICESTTCDVTVRSFNDAVTRPDVQKDIEAPKS